MEEPRTRPADRAVTRFGIVGFGLHAVRRLMPGFSASREAVVTALSRRDEQRARQSAAEYGIPHWFSGAAALCELPEVDAVLVTTPNSAHLPDVLTALRYGKPVLVEKPMGMNAGECRQMVAAAEAAGVLLGVAQVFRFTHSLNRIRAMIRAGDVGEPLFARCDFSYPGLRHARSWIGKREISGGGPVMDVGIHCVDALRYLLEQEVTHVAAFARFDHNWPEVEAAATLGLRFQSGVLATISVSARAEYRTPVEIVGTSGAIRADDGLTVDRPITIELRRGGELVRREEVNNQDAYARQVDAFARAVRSFEPFPAPGHDGIRNQNVLDAAYRSLQTSRIEEVGKP
ncbi:MAG: Gfo/Idh/MocA family oxidoreductase [Acidobacteria bacterium]|nr:Gfo/Idh/MocA family oxidoreductase [Acidobacteriota bacterium]